MYTSVHLVCPQAFHFIYNVKYRCERHAIDRPRKTARSAVAIILHDRRARSAMEKAGGNGRQRQFGLEAIILGSHRDQRPSWTHIAHSTTSAAAKLSIRSRRRSLLIVVS
jgi:hypothetical protein